MCLCDINSKINGKHKTWLQVSKIYALLSQNTIKFTHQKVKCTSLISVTITFGLMSQENNPERVSPAAPWGRWPKPDWICSIHPTLWEHALGSPEGAPGTGRGSKGGNTQKHTAPPSVPQSSLGTQPNPSHSMSHSYLLRQASGINILLSYLQDA